MCDSRLALAARLPNYFAGMRTLHRPLAFAALGSWLSFAAVTFAQTQDAPAPDLSSLLQELKKIREQQVQSEKQQRQAALQQVTAAAASPERAAGLWEDAVRAIQFDGATKEGTAFKEWKDREGEGLNSKEGRNAARLYFNWLKLTILRDAGTPVKELLPQVVAHTKELSADREMMEALEESIKKDKELAASGKHGMKRQGDDDKAKRMHDQILNKGLAGSPVVQWLKLKEFVNPPQWENNPGDFDGIFNNIILPELRAQKDPRLLEYWDMRLKKEADAASKQKLTFAVEKYNNERRPALLWSRADDLLLLGQKNRAIGEMFNLIKTYPRHPSADTWIARLEAILVPPPPGAATAAPAAPTVTGAAPEAPPVVK
jgi:hypothetical protein